MKVPALVKKVLRLAEARSAAWEAQHGGVSWQLLGQVKLAALARRRDGPEQIALRRYLHNLRPAEVYLLVLILEIGRGDLAPTNLLSDYAHISDAFANPADAADYLADAPRLSEDLCEGVWSIRDGRVDVEGVWGE